MLVLGNPVKTLRRVRIGPLRLGRMRRGEVRPLRPGEVAALLSYVERLRAGEKVSFSPVRDSAGPVRVTKPGRPERKTASKSRGK